ncbi:MAG TPA: aminotransferase class IV [Anaerolineaceae bacterium]|nr:aminotransferase class IV [Anaerolineaceae bacterium]
MIKTWQLFFPDHRVELEPVSSTTGLASLDQVSRRLPGGAYTTLRTFAENRVILLENHFNRLEESARLTGVPISLQRDALRQGIREGLLAFGKGEKRIRLTLDLERDPGAIYLSVEPLKTPAAGDYREGIRAITCRLARENPKAKRTQFISIASGIRSELPQGVNEALMVQPDGTILEGLSSNFFGVRGNSLWTADEGVLNGITRKVVLDEARQAGIPAHFNPLELDELKSLDEAFITSSSRAVLPVVQIDEWVIGSGAPGPITKTLLDRYNQWVEREAQSV